MTQLLLVLLALVFFILIVKNNKIEGFDPPDCVGKAKGGCGKGCVWFDSANHGEGGCFGINDLHKLTQSGGSPHNVCENTFHSLPVTHGHELPFYMTDENDNCINTPICVPNTITDVGWSNTRAPDCRTGCQKNSGVWYLPDPHRQPMGDGNDDWKQLGNITQNDIHYNGCYLENNTYHGYSDCNAGNRALCYRENLTL